MRQLAETRLPVRGFNNRMTAVFEQLTHRVSDFRIVIHDKYFGHWLPLPN